MINSIKNGDQPLPRVTQVSIAGTSSTEQPYLKDKSMCNKTAKDLSDALARHMLGSEYGEQDRKAAKCGYSKDNCELNFKFLNNLQPEWKQYTTMMRQKKNLMDINIDALYNILKQNQGDVNDAMGSKKKTVMVTSHPLALIAEKTKVSKRDVNDAMGSKKKTVLVTSDPLALIADKTKVSKSKEKVVVSSDLDGSEADDFNDKKVEKKADEKKRDISRVKCYNCNKEGHFAKDCKKAKVKDYEYYKTKMLLAKKDKDGQVLLAEDQAWMESSSDSDQE
nr:ribonuclease H-like domain-containing protein [Tanacetum cinerariifolium]